MKQSKQALVAAAARSPGNDMPCPSGPPGGSGGNSKEDDAGDGEGWGRQAACIASGPEGRAVKRCSSSCHTGSAASAVLAGLSLQEQRPDQAFRFWIDEVWLH
jgi:hypothetical protein